jgi:hypothetical protein
MRHIAAHVLDKGLHPGPLIAVPMHLQQVITNARNRGSTIQLLIFCQVHDRLAAASTAQCALARPRQDDMMQRQNIFDRCMPHHAMYFGHSGLECGRRQTTQQQTASSRQQPRDTDMCKVQ